MKKQFEVGVNEGGGRSGYRNRVWKRVRGPKRREKEREIEVEYDKEMVGELEWKEMIEEMEWRKEIEKEDELMKEGLKEERRSWKEENLLKKERK